MSACLPVLPPLLFKLNKIFQLNTNNLTWLRPHPSTISHPTKTYNTTTWPGTPATPRSPRGPRKLSSVTKFHRLYDVGNLLGNPPPPPSAAALLPKNVDEDEEVGCIVEMENQSDPESLRNIRISKGWGRCKVGTTAPPSSPRW